MVDSSDLSVSLLNPTSPTIKNSIETFAKQNHRQSRLQGVAKLQHCTLRGKFLDSLPRGENQGLPPGLVFE